MYIAHKITLLYPIVFIGLFFLVYYGLGSSTAPLFNLYYPHVGSGVLIGLACFTLSFTVGQIFFMLNGILKKTKGFVQVRLVNNFIFYTILATIGPTLFVIGVDPIPEMLVGALISESVLTVFIMITNRKFQRSGIEFSILK